MASCKGPLIDKALECLINVSREKQKILLKREQETAVNLSFLICFTLYLRTNISPRGAYIWRGDLTEGFFALPDWGAYIWRGLYMEGLIFVILR